MVIVDEIGTKEEVAAVRTIAQRGIVLIGTAHGENLHSMLKNPECKSLVGGAAPITVGDEAAKLQVG